MATVVLARRRYPRIEAGHPWVFRTEVDAVRGTFEPGDLVEVADHRGRFLGRGYINPASQILVRLLTRADEPIDAAFFLDRVSRAWEYRRRVLGAEPWALESCRAIFGEADGLPALIVDRFRDILVVQSLALGIEVRMPLVVEALRQVFAPRGIYARNDVPVRSLEGLGQGKGWLLPPEGAGEGPESGAGTASPAGEAGPAPRDRTGGEPWGGEPAGSASATPADLAMPQPIAIREGPVTFRVDYASGQKTGFFLDQRENRLAVARLLRGARVLDAFAYTGGFGLQALAAGAREVVAVESSTEASALAHANAALNGVAERYQAVTANAFDHLRALDRARERFDAVILDPPAFVKGRAALEGALRGYKEINLRALRILAPGGLLITCSCSYHLGEDEFRSVVLEAAVDAGRNLRVIEARGQARDHPVLLAAPETRYLKCLVAEVG
ncbi:MAG: class I SAM-dependent rRNA methyltransferase [Acetobacteraceae bacterium]|nr:class I SAM-dependent rRNA methyltransferase [Acetobacteraceae bacterium]